METCRDKENREANGECPGKGSSGSPGSSVEEEMLLQLGEKEGGILWIGSCAAWRTRWEPFVEMHDNVRVSRRSS
jgi:hypothetical protein